MSATAASADLRPLVTSVRALVPLFVTLTRAGDRVDCGQGGVPARQGGRMGRSVRGLCIRYHRLDVARRARGFDADMM